MKIILIGSSGKMGKAVCDSAADKYEIYKVDKENSESFFSDRQKIGDVVLDFSTPILTDKLCDYALATKTPLVIGSTGHAWEQLARIKKLSETLPVFLSGNMSIGIALFAKHLREILKIYKDSQVDIVETHHTQKIDSPSGTALILARAVQSVNQGKILFGSPNGKRNQNDICVFSRRMGKVVGEHTAIIHTSNQTFTLTHNAESRAIFAEGALNACEFITQKKFGLFSVQDLLEGY